MRMLQYSPSSPSPTSLTRLPETIPSVELLTAMIWRIRLNGFTVCDGESVPYGVGLCSNPASFINHSCGKQTNALQTFWFRPGCMPSLCLTVFGNNSIQPGDEICISYMDTMHPSHLRQSQLQRNYYFWCTCDACIDCVENEDGWRMGLLCERCRSRIAHRGKAMAPSPPPSSYQCLNCINTDFSKSIEFLKLFEQQQEKQFQKRNDNNSSMKSLSQLRETYNKLKRVCAHDSWYVQESGDQLLQATLDQFSSSSGEDQRQLLGFEALKIIEELLGEDDHRSRPTSGQRHPNDHPYHYCRETTTSSYLRYYQLLYKGAKLRLFLIPDPRRSIQELQDVMTAFRPFFPQDHDVMNDLHACLMSGMQ
jgi:SET domain